MVSKSDTLNEEFNVGQEEKKDVVDMMLEQIDFMGVTAETVTLPS